MLCVGELEEEGRGEGRDRSEKNNSQSGVNQASCLLSTNLLATWYMVVKGSMW